VVHTVSGSVHLALADQREGTAKPDDVQRRTVLERLARGDLSANDAFVALKSLP
jgi:hypothetical protein